MLKIKQNNSSNHNNICHGFSKGVINAKPPIIFENFFAKVNLVKYMIKLRRFACVHTS